MGKAGSDLMEGETTEEAIQCPRLTKRPEADGGVWSRRHLKRAVEDFWNIPEKL